MADVEEFVDTVLKHYSSPWYDPAKAHEYYLRTRELKGPSTSDLKGKKKKQAFTVAKANINEAKKQELKQLVGTKKFDAVKVRANAKNRQTEVRNSIKGLLLGLKQDLNGQRQSIANDRDARIKKINAETQAKLDALPPLPKTVSKEVRYMRAQEIAKIKGEGKAKSGKVLAETKAQELQLKSNTSAETKQAQARSKAQTKKVTSELKSAVSNSQTKYKGLRDQMVAKYKAILQSEHDAIKQNQ